VTSIESANGANMEGGAKPVVCRRCQTVSGKARKRRGILVRDAGRRRRLQKGRARDGKTAQHGRGTIERKGSRGAIRGGFSC